MASASASNATSRVVMQMGSITCERPLVLTPDFKRRAWSRRRPPNRIAWINRTNPRFRSLRLGLGHE
jgi:hypothetical protein